MKTLGEKTIQNTKDIVKNAKDITSSEDDIANSQIDIVKLFERVVRIETKIDMSSDENRNNNGWIRSLLLVVIMIELANMLFNYLLFIRV